MTTAILWFRRDLRLTDNPALQTALATCSRLLPVYIGAADEESPWQPGEEGALIRLARFLEDAIADYPKFLS